MADGLDGIRVIEIGEWVAVPAAGAILADLGAEVIHVEHPVRGDAYRGYRLGEPNYGLENDDRNKKGLAIDLLQSEGQEIIRRLVAQSDVFVSNLRPYQLVKFGFEYDSLAKLNPKLIVANLNGLGQKGPEQDDPGNDFACYWTRAGVMATLGVPGKPPPASRGGFGDHMTAMLLTAAIALALLIRERTGIGQEVNVSLFNTGIYALGMDMARALNLGEDIRQAPRESALNPLMNYYRTKDDRWIVLSIPRTDPYWATFCKAIEREELEKQARFSSHSSREQNNEELISILDEVFAGKTYEEWKKRLGSFKIAAWAPAQTVLEVTSDQQAIDNEIFVDFEHPSYGTIKLLATPVKFSKTPGTVRSRAPELGEHTEEILLSAGYSWEDIIALKSKNVIP